MKKYYVHYYRDFSNTYRLRWTDRPAMEHALPEGVERITRNRHFFSGFRQMGFACATVFWYI